MKTYLITGAAGFIGSNLAEKLVSKEYKIINIDNFNDYYDLEMKVRNIYESVNTTAINNEKLMMNNKKKEILKELKPQVDSNNYNLEIVDIRDKVELERVFKKNEIDLVINLAAMAGVRPSIEDPILYEEVNIKGFMNILEMCKKYEVKKVIQASSSVYGNNKKVPFEETDVVDFAISPYAATKKSGEVMGHVYHDLYDIDIIQLRFFTVYGPRQRPDLAIYKFTKLINNGIEIPFYGDGTTERDYTYIDDIVDGIIKSIDYLENNTNVYEIFNLGESRTISLNKMVSTIENALGIEAIINRQPMQPGDVKRTNADISKARKILGYDPQTDFEEGISKFVTWFNKQNK